NLLNGLKLVVAETIGYIIEATLVSKLPPKAQDPTPKRRHNKLLISRETGELNEELKASTMERTNSENVHMSNLTASASIAPK
ncbi:hypothetical protein Gohar_001029, partial [Gossypium harknessii]|nr:hypothetical protein [Gossypium harknessii]